MYTDTRDGIDTLVDYVIQTASRQPELTRAPVDTATLEEVVEGTVLVVENEAQARMSRLLAEAFAQMSRDMHPEDEWPDLKGSITPEQAYILVKEHGGLRPAARATGTSRTKLWRALKEYTGELV